MALTNINDSTLFIAIFFKKNIMTENSCRLFLRENEYFVLCQLVTCNYAGNVNHVAIKCKVNFMYNIKNFNTHPVRNLFYYYTGPGLKNFGLEANKIFLAYIFKNQKKVAKIQSNDSNSAPLMRALTLLPVELV